MTIRRPSPEPTSVSQRVVLFGDGQVAELVRFYLDHDSPHEVVAFTVDGPFLQSDTKQGLPVVAFEQIRDLYPPDEFRMFVALGWRSMNQLRESKYHEAKDLGYDLITYLSSKATTWPDLNVGDNCLALEGSIVQPYASIGSDVVLWSGCHIGHHSRVEDHCFVSPRALVASDVQVGSNSFVGAGATIRDGIVIGSATLVGAGALIMKDTRPHEVYVGASGELLPLRSDRLPPSVLSTGTQHRRQT